MIIHEIRQERIKPRSKQNLVYSLLFPTGTTITSTYGLPVELISAFQKNQISKFELLSSDQITKSEPIESLSSDIVFKSNKFEELSSSNPKSINQNEFLSTISSKQLDKLESLSLSSSQSSNHNSLEFLSIFKSTQSNLNPFESLGSISTQSITKCPFEFLLQSAAQGQGNNKIELLSNYNIITNNPFEIASYPSVTIVSLGKLPLEFLSSSHASQFGKLYFESLLTYSVVVKTPFEFVPIRILVTATMQAQDASTDFNVLGGIPTVVGSFIEQVFQPFVNLLIAGMPTVFNSSNCLVSTREEIPDFSGAPFCWLYPADFDEDELQVTGSGRNVSGINGTFILKLRTRNLQDPAYQDTQAYISPSSTLGMYVISDQIINILHLCFPQDSSGNMIVETPPIFVNMEQATRVETGREYSGFDIVFYVSLYLKISQNVPSM